jgi:hypothetical protein
MQTRSTDGGVGSTSVVATDFLAKAKRELRVISEFNEQAIVVGTRQTKEHTLFVYFHRNSGAISERAFDRHGVGTTNKAIEVKDWAIDDVPIVRFTDNHWYIGGSSEEAIWSGALGEQVVAGTVPTALTAWYPASSTAIVGLDQEGTLHLLRRSGAKWNSTDHLKNFIQPENTHLHADRRRAFASNGPPG